MRDFKFPTTISEHDIYFIHFEFFQIEPIAITEELLSDPESNDLVGVVSRTFNYDSRMEKLTDTIRLPIKTAITEETSGTYDEQSMRSLSSFAQMLSGDNAGNAMDLVMDQVMNSKFVPESARAAIGVATQTAINQRIQVFYTGPNRRTYTMEFPLVAKNIDDARELRLIARRLQYHASPSLVNSQTRWTYPNLTSFKFMRYVYNQSPNNEYVDTSQRQGRPILEEVESLFKSKKCYLENVSVQHGDDRYMQFTDGTDFETGIMTITLTLKEIDYFLQEDFDDFSSAETETE